jgi:hypothetical protein
MYLASKRVHGDDGEYKFQTYIDKLKSDKKFFTKLQGMAGNDSTRKNIYNFFRKDEIVDETESNHKLVVEKAIRL